jgi:hypothetical protein
MAHAPQSQADHRFVHRLHQPPSSEHGRIGHAHALRGDGFVARDQPHHLIEVDFRRRLV